MAKRSRSSQHWLERQERDQYSKKARSQGHPSRALYKLEQLDERFRLFFEARYVLELGGAPGGWTQYVEQKIPHNGKLITVDPLDVKTGQRSIHICGLVGSDLVNRRIAEVLNGTKVDIVISDMAPNISGVKERDRAESLRLNLLTVDMAQTYLKNKGVAVMKTFQNPQVANLVEEIKNSFSSVRIVKPAASRKESSEVYVVAQGFRALGSRG